MSHMVDFHFWLTGQDEVTWSPLVAREQRKSSVSAGYKTRVLTEYRKVGGGADPSESGEKRQ